MEYKLTFIPYFECVQRLLKVLRATVGRTSGYRQRPIDEGCN